MLRAPPIAHSATVGGLAGSIFGDCRRTRAGEVLMGPFAVRLGSTTEVLPDLLFISHERRLILTDTRVEGAPDLLIEVISPKSKKIDQILKRDLYAKYGVRYYWIVEPLAEWIRAYELGADGLYELVAE